MAVRCLAACSFAIATSAIPIAAEDDPNLVDLEALRALEQAEEPDAAPGKPSHDELEAQLQADQAAEEERRAAAAAMKKRIDDQLRVQSELLSRQRGEERAGGAAAAELADANPRVAPGPPEMRELPDEIFDREEVSIPSGTWGNRSLLRVYKLTLDADGDGRTELVRYVDRKSKLLIRHEEDRNYDGVTDSWSDFEWGAIVTRVLDSNDDGNPDVWERYAKERMTTREIDRDDDGVRDAFYEYRGDSIARERHDSNNDGQPDLIIVYEHRLRTSAEEDRDKDGRMDAWTTYIAVGDKEVIARIERDELGEGSVTTVEIFDTETGEAVITRREQDVNGDGEIDVTSIYEDGKLVRREIADPKLVSSLGESA